MFLMLLLGTAMTVNAANLKVNLTVSNLKSNKGHILFVIFNNSEGFPGKPSVDAKKGKFRADQKDFVIDDLMPGTYAVSAFHDENDNENLDTNFLGIPKEGVGFSNNPFFLFGPPSYEKASFVLKESVSINIKLKHF